MSLFGIMNNYYQNLQELSIGGNSIDDNDDDFQVDTDGAEEPETPNPGEGAEPTNEEPTEEETGGTDTPENNNDNATPEPAAEPQQNTPEPAPQEQQPAENNDAGGEPAPQNDGGAEPTGEVDPGTDGENIQDDFSLPDDNGGEDENPEGGEPEGEDGDVGEDGEGIQDDFSMDDEEGGEGEGEGTEGDVGGTGTDDAGTDMGGGENGGSDPTTENIKKSEEEIYETLTDEQKKNRILQLKIDFQALYQQADSTISAVNEIPKTEDNIESIHRIINVMNDVKKYVVDYMAVVFDKTSFLDNNANYVKYVAIFDTTRKAIDEINKIQNDG